MVLKGCIDDIVFRNEENGYTIAVLDVSGEPVTAAGVFPPLSEGESVSVTGDYVIHPKFGKQFKVKNAQVLQPNTLDGLVRYLGSGLIKGIGPKTALAIVSYFGESTLDVIEFAPFKLTKIKGISRAKAAGIAEEYVTIKDMKDSIIFLQGRNISLNLSLRIYKKFGKDTVAVVKTNPYRLIEEIDGIGFLTADKIALEVGVSIDSPFRIGAGILHVLTMSGERNGNTFLPDEILFEEAAKLLETDVDAVRLQTEQMVLSGRIRRFSDGENNGFASAATYRAEKSAAVKLISLRDEANGISVNCDSEIDMFETINSLKLHLGQKEAVKSAVMNGVSVITGGPGTGKTTIIKCILSIFDSNNLTYTLMAPTGRAAKRLSEATGRDAGTIHRAIMLTPGNLTGGEIVLSDAVIVDEFSMSDIFLFNSLLSHLRQGTKLILVGDKDQLPSVGAGNVLSDVMSSGLIPVVNLTEVYRQSEASLITLNAHAINRGELPLLTNNKSDFFFIKEKEADRIADVATELACVRLPKYLGLDASRVQILSPIKNGLAGTVNLNRLMQKKLNPADSAFIESEGVKFRAGDRVMHTVNNYSLTWKRISQYGTTEGEGVFNGDLGYIQEIRAGAGEMDVLMEDGRLITYTQDIKNQLILAYAITVHKSQGSEFDGCVIPIYGGNPMILTRNLLYTAITRAKKIVVLVGEEYNIKRMVDNNYIAKRYSMLKTFLEEASRKMSILYGDPFQEND